MASESSVCKNSLGFKGRTQHYGDPTLMSELETNFKHWLDWSFLCIGSWQEVSTSSTGLYGGNFHELHHNQDESYDSHHVYYSIRKDWPYETNVDYKNPTQAIESVANATGTDKVVINLEPPEESYYQESDRVYIDNPALSGEYEVLETIDSNSFYLKDKIESLDFQDGTDFFLQDGTDLEITYLEVTGTGLGGTVYGIYNPSTPVVYSNGSLVNSGDYSIDYPNGKIIFNTSREGEAITASYPYRTVQTYISNQSKWAFEVQQDSFDPSNASWTASSVSGDYATDPVNRVQLPAVIIESVGGRTSRGYELGSSALKKNQDILMTVIADNSYDRNTITDILADQEHKTIQLYDTDKVVKNNKMPLNFYGDINESGANYNVLARSEDYYWAKAYITQATVSSVDTKSQDIHMSKIRYKVEVIQ